jgi:tetratricopeptide (TPR) repeat protein
MQIENESGTTSAARPEWRRHGGVLASILVLAVFLSYQPVWHAGFVWDDDDHVTANPCIVGPLGLKELWTTNHARYYPLVSTTFWAEHKLWGLWPLPFHLVNVLVHAADALILWRLLRLLAVPGAWFAAALWALHPVMVETVAWVTELKNAQSCLFYLLSIFFFVKWLKDPQRSNATYVGCLLCAALAMLSKSSTVILPLELLLIAWWVESRCRWQTWARVAPVFFLSLLAALLAIWTVDLQGVNEDREWLRSWPERFITAGAVFWFYLGKLAWPHPLIFIYPRWPIEAAHATSYLPLLGAMALVIVLWFKRNSGLRPAFIALAYFVIALLPVFGLIEHYFLRYSFVADHLQYLASIGPLVFVGGGLTCFADRLLPRESQWRAILAGGVLLLLGTATWQRSHAFENQFTLWTDTLAKNPSCWLADNNLACLLLQSGHADAAIAYFDQALAVKPNLSDTQFNLGNAYMQKGLLDDAIAHFEKSLALDPDNASAEGNLGLAYFQKGRVDDAIAHYRNAIALKPGIAQAHYNLANALAKKGQPNEPIAQYRQAIAINPDYFNAHYQLGNALLNAYQLQDAIDEYQVALQINPNSAKTHNNLGITLLRLGQTDAGIAQLEEAVRLSPDYAEARDNLEKARAAAAKPAASRPSH